MEEKDQAEAEAARPLIIDWMPSAMVVAFPDPLPGFPAPLRTTMIELPKELTAPYANLDQVSFTVRFLHAPATLSSSLSLFFPHTHSHTHTQTDRVTPPRTPLAHPHTPLAHPPHPHNLAPQDCAECCLLRFVQLALLSPSSLPHMRDSAELNPPSPPQMRSYDSASVDVLRAAALGADPRLLDYFRAFPRVHWERAAPGDDQGARDAWAALVSQRESVRYVRRGGFEMAAGLGNFLAALCSLFPGPGGLPDTAGRAPPLFRTDVADAYADALAVACAHLSSAESWVLSVGAFAFVGPLRCGRGSRSNGLWINPMTLDTAPHPVAVDREASVDVHVNGQAVYHFDLWDRHFLTCGGDEELTSGHAEMSAAGPAGDGGGGGEGGGGCGGGEVPINEAGARSSVTFVDAQGDRSTIVLRGTTLSWHAGGVCYLDAIAKLKVVGCCDTVAAPEHSSLVAELVDPPPGPERQRLFDDIVRMARCAGVPLSL